MAKFVFIGLPLISVHKAFLPILNELAYRGHDITYFNTDNFRSDNNLITFKAYSSQTFSYDTQLINQSTSFFAFSEILVDTSMQLVEKLRKEVLAISPDLILHSHLALWGKLVCKVLEIPGVCLYTTFSLNKTIMLPYLRRNIPSKEKYKETGIDAILRVQRKYVKLYKEIGLEDKIDIWDSYTNEQPYNIFLIHKELIIKKETINGYKFFAGYPLTVKNSTVKRSIIYVSMGTVFNDDSNLFKTIINCLTEIKIPAVISIGNKINLSEFENIPAHLSLVPYLDQEAMLNKALVFITRGGMASVHEAIANLTPMIIIPEIPEQHITAERLEDLGVGIKLRSSTQDELVSTISLVLSSRQNFVERMRPLVQVTDNYSPDIIVANVVENIITKISNQV